MKKYVRLCLAALLIALFAMPVSAKAAVNVKEGTYYFYSGVGNRVLDVKGAGKSNGTNVQIYTPNKTKAQQFKVQKSGKYYKIINVNSGKALDVKGGSTANKGNVQQYKWNGTKAQLWTFESAGSGMYYIKNVKSGKYLDVAGGKTKNGTNVWQYKLNRTKAQKWKLTAVQSVATKVKGTKEFVEVFKGKPATVSGVKVSLQTNGDTYNVVVQQGSVKTTVAKNAGTTFTNGAVVYYCTSNGATGPRYIYKYDVNTKKTTNVVSSNHLVFLDNAYDKYIYYANLADNTVVAKDTETGKVVKMKNYDGGDGYITVSGGKVYSYNDAGWDSKSSEDTLSRYTPAGKLEKTVKAGDIFALSNYNGQLYCIRCRKSGDDRQYAVYTMSTEMKPVKMVSNWADSYPEKYVSW